MREGGQCSWCGGFPPRSMCMYVHGQTTGRGSVWESGGEGKWKGMRMGKEVEGIVVVT